MPKPGLPTRRDATLAVGTFVAYLLCAWIPLLVAVQIVPRRLAPELSDMERVRRYLGMQSWALVGGLLAAGVLLNLLALRYYPDVILLIRVFVVHLAGSIHCIRYLDQQAEILAEEFNDEGEVSTTRPTLPLRVYAWGAARMVLLLILSALLRRFL